MIFRLFITRFLSLHGSYDFVMPCSSFNWCNAVCKRCVCACAKKPCSTCLPMKDNKCVNTLPLHVNLVTDSSHNCVFLSQAMDW